MGLKMRYQSRKEDTLIVDTYNDDKGVVYMNYSETPPRTHDIEAALALLNVGINPQQVVDMLKGPPPRRNMTWG